MRSLVLLLTFLLSPLAAAAPPCRAVPGADAVVKPGARVIFGEMHGTNETQRLVGDVACAAAARGPLRVGLEIPVDEQPRIDAFVRSAGGEADKKALLTGAFWTRDTQDGRSSTAMLALLDSLRTLARAGRDVRVVAFDVPSTTKKADGRDRDRDMATALSAAFRREPQATFVVLVGNLHARKAPHPQFKQRFMAQYLVDDKQPIVTLNAEMAVGSMWVCFNTGCGPYATSGGATAPEGITLSATRDGAYDGTFGIGTPTYAAPAAKPLTAAQKQLIALLDLGVDANRARRDKHWPRYATVSLALASKDAANASGHLYDAACGYALAGDAANAFKQLAAAVDHGFADRAWLEQDDDLASLHGDARWKTLVARLPAPKK